jgi:microcystin-dependent protein
MDSYIGQIIAVGFKLVPASWLACDGTLYPISQYELLFTLIGITYGGDGVTNFAVPDLRGRLVVGQGQGPGLSPYELGQTGGVESVQLSPSQIGAHRHALMTGTRPTPPPEPPPSGPGAGIVLTTNTQPLFNVYSDKEPDVSLSRASISDDPFAYTAHENRQPHLAINYIICSSGIFPSRP